MEMLDKEQRIALECSQLQSDGTDVKGIEQLQDVNIDEAGDGEEKMSCDNTRNYTASPNYSNDGFMDCTAESGIEMELSNGSLEDTLGLDSDERNQLFACGLALEKEGKREEALKSYMGCLSGLSHHTDFLLLPQCLHNIADIYYQSQEYDKAIHFIQAEKLCYENALINTEEIHKQLEELTDSEGKEEHRDEPDEGSMETLRAEDYEHLSKLFLDRDQPHLALEYAGKGAKLRQKMLGEDHPKTRESLDFFASVYAEVSRQRYGDSLEILNNNDEKKSHSESSAPSETQTGDDCPPVIRRGSILKHRRNSEKKKQVRFHESVVDNSTQREQEEWVSHTLRAFLLFGCFFCISLVGLGLYCCTVDTNLSQRLMETVRDTCRSVRLQYHKYTSTKPVKFA